MQMSPVASSSWSRVEERERGKKRKTERQGRTNRRTGTRIRTEQDKAERGGGEGRRERLRREDRQLISIPSTSLFNTIDL